MWTGLQPVQVPILCRLTSARVEPLDHVREQQCWKHRHAQQAICSRSDGLLSQAKLPGDNGKCPLVGTS